MADGETDIPATRVMLATGTYLGFILVTTRAAVKRVHGPGGELEGYPVDWVQALCIAAWHAKRHMETRGHDG